MTWTFPRTALVALICLMACFARADAAENASGRRAPNIVVILADDLGYTDLGVYGSSFYETPNLDRLAAQGMRFTDAYSACPVCSPTRVSFMTGQYPARVGLTDYLYGHTRGKLIPAKYVDHLPLELFNLPRALQQNGYATWHVGKWHLGAKPYYPAEQGFAVNIAGGRRGSPNKGYFSPFNIENLSESEKDGEFLTDRLTDEAIRLIRSNKDKPFYLNYWAYAPHVPIQAPKELIAKYEAKAKQRGIDQSKAIREDEFFPIENKKDRRITRRLIQSDPVYAALIENLDTNIGRLLQALEETGQAENTIVLFTSDNGGLSTAEGAPTNNAPLNQGKGWMYEGGIRVPLIVRWPGVVKEGSTSSTPVTTPDYLPTLMEAAGVAIPDENKIDGVSLVSLLRHAQGLNRQALYWHYPHYGNQGGSPAAAVRAGDWKLIQFFEDDRFELYNLKDDVRESHDLAAARPEKTQELKAMLGAWQHEVGAKFPTPNPDYQPRP